MDNFITSIRRAANNENAIIVIGGDFNLPGWDWRSKTLKKNNHPTIHREFRDNILELGFEQMIQNPTRGENFLDLFLINNPNLVPRTETLPGLSDHDAAYMEVQIHPPRRRQPRRRIPLYSEECIEPLRDAVNNLSNQILEKYDIDSDVETVWKELRDGLLQACADHVRHKTSKSKTSLPWIDQETKKMIRRRDRVHKRYKKTGRKDLEKEFHDLKRDIQRRIRRSYWQYVERLVTDRTEDPEPTTPNKKLYCFNKKNGRN